MAGTANLDFDVAIKDLMALLQIPGPPGQEHEVAQHLQGVLGDIGIRPEQIYFDRAHQQSEYGGTTGNLIVRLDGHGRGGRRLFSAHMDTVPLAVGGRPLLRPDKQIICNQVAGKALGGDNRTGCAILVQVARALAARAGQHPPTTLVFFVQEEVGLVGSRGLDIALLGSPLPSLGFNFDGEQADEFITAVIGTERFTIDIDGIAAHSGLNPGDGVSAAIIAAQALAGLARDGWHGPITKPDGCGSANIGILQGGMGSNVVMPALHILAEARAHDPAFRRVIIDNWKKSFQHAADTCVNRQGARGKVCFGPGPTYEAFALKSDAPVIKMALAAAGHCGIQAQCVANDGGMDANWIVAHGIPTITIGGGQRHVHTPAEEIDLGHYRDACRLAGQLAIWEDADGGK